LEPEPLDNLLGHEMVPHVPTDLPVQCCGHDIVNPKVHALRCFLKGRSVAFRFRFHLEAECDALRRLGRLRCAPLYRGMGRQRSAVMERAWSAVGAQGYTSTIRVPG
jgi:hypothetical protein